MIQNKKLRDKYITSKLKQQQYELEKANTFNILSSNVIVQKNSIETWWEESLKGIKYGELHTMSACIGMGKTMYASRVLHSDFTPDITA